MKKTQRFQIEKHEGEYKDWPLKSYLIDDGVKTSTKLPGYDLLASFAIDNGKFLLILDYACPTKNRLQCCFDSNFKIVGKKKFPDGLLLNGEKCESESQKSLLVPSFGCDKFRVEILDKKYFWQSFIVIHSLK